MGPSLRALRIRTRRLLLRHSEAGFPAEVEHAAAATGIEDAGGVLISTRTETGTASGAAPRIGSGDVIPEMIAIVETAIRIPTGCLISEMIGTLGIGATGT